MSRCIAFRRLVNRIRAPDRRFQRTERARASGRRTTVFRRLRNSSKASDPKLWPKPDIKKRAQLNCPPTKHSTRASLVNKLTGVLARTWVIAEGLQRSCLCPTFLRAALQPAIRWVCCSRACLRCGSGFSNCMAAAITRGVNVSLRNTGSGFAPTIRTVTCY